MCFRVVLGGGFGGRGRRSEFDGVDGLIMRTPILSLDMDMRI